LSQEDIEHNPDDTVCKINAEEWTKRWWQWMLRIREQDNPFIHYEGGPYRRRIDQLQGEDQEDCEERVYFLAGSPYGESNVAKSIIPEGNWSVLATPYVCGAAQAEYPSLGVNDLNNLVRRDVEGVREMVATLDDMVLTPFRITTTRLFTVTQLPDDNILGIPNSRLGSNRSIEMVQDGYWIWLRPLDPGDHWLHLRGYSRNYQLDTNYHLSVTGPPR
jgi:hypothetical protein